MDARLRGIFPPIPTTFDHADRIDTRAMTANVTRWMTTPLAGVLALGSNGEAVLLDEAESDLVLATVRDAVPSSRLLIAGTGRESTRATIDACRRAAALGADAVLVRPPAYYKTQMTPDALIDHFRRVADAAPVPTLLYNLPVTGVVLNQAVVASLAEHPNIVGLKETSSELERLGQFAAIDPRFRVLSGSAPVVYPALVSGASGGILAVANVLPGECVALFEHARAGRHAEALALQRAITPLAQLVTSVYGVAGLKLALDLLGFHGGPTRSPLLPPPDRARADIERALAAFEQMTHAADD
jgi:4-hydroxy-2-oxoglutarate aldolase